jgi:uncharacterized heparinase superfamily protein
LLSERASSNWSYISKLGLYFNTLKYLRWEQIFYRLKYKLFPLRNFPEINQELSTNECRAEFAFWQKGNWKTATEVSFLNVTKKIDSSKNWIVEAEPLWLYNLHYFDELNSINHDEKLHFHSQLIHDWIRLNRVVKSIAFQPYPTSLRVVNWAKFFFRYPGDLPSEWIKSFAIQALVLVKKREFHLLGNHLYANGKALIFAGTLINGPLGQVFLTKGLEIVDKENEEQFLSDGGHFELSPMYHSILLMDLIELISLAQSANINALTMRIESWSTIATKAFLWMEAMQHPDNDIAFFNDSSFGIAPPIAAMKEYYNKVLPGKVTSEQLLSQFPDCIQLTASGYTVVQNYLYKAMLDTAKIGPNYLPGHAHADTLSFELSIQGKRFLVNSGTSRYGVGEEREYQRSTKAHNTVVVDGYNSSEVWGGFRVANRAEPLEYNVTESPEKLNISCAHNGYLKTQVKSVHTRAWEFKNKSISIIDLIKGTFKQSIAYFYLHPDVKIISHGIKSVEFEVSGVLVRLRTNAQKIKIKDAKWFPEFGQSIQNKCVELNFVCELETVFELEIKE